jgi:hypothetical protein
MRIRVGLEEAGAFWEDGERECKERHMKRVSGYCWGLGKLFFFVHWGKHS